MNEHLPAAAILAILGNGSLWAAEPTPAPPSIQVRTYYERMVPYTLHSSGCDVRSGTDAEQRVQYDRDFSARELGPFQRTAAVQALQRDIGVRLGTEPRPEEVWEAARSILTWLREHSTYDPDGYNELAKSGGPSPSRGKSPGGWPKVETIAAYYARQQSLAYAACFSHAHLAFQLFRIAGLPTEDFGIASAHYMKDREGKQLREHVYLGLRVGGEWYYIDPSAAPLPPYARRVSVGRKVGELKGCDYAHPHLFKTAAEAKFKAIPLLGPRRPEASGISRPRGQDS